MSRPSIVGEEVNKRLEAFIALMRQVDREQRWSEIEDTYLQQLIECVIKAYVARLQENGINGKTLVPPIGDNTALTETDVLIMILKLLEAKHLDIFEISMFRSYWIHHN